MKKPTVLMILDGYGLANPTEGNAITTANTPNIDKLLNDYPFEKGYASGLDVGLPDGQMGNSEVGHLNIGAGRVVYQELTKITKSIQDGDFFEKPEFLEAIENCKKNGSDLHLYGLLSDGGVHSHTSHLNALLKLAKDNGLSNVYVHAFLDGRDTPPTSAKGFIEGVEAEMKSIGVGEIATIIGRFYVLDRDNRFERVKLAYDVLTSGKGETAASAVQCMENTYAKGVNDEMVLPTAILKDGKPVATIKENDSVIFFNFRPDRAREITRAFCDPNFDGFERPNGYFPLKYVCFTEYDVTIPNKSVVYKKEKFTNTFGEYISNKGLTQTRMAETEKYAHVTFFFNGGIEEPYKNEERILVPSPKVTTYDMQPEMSAAELTDRFVETVESGKSDVIIINYANPDMVGHTGIIKAAVEAVETVDACVGRAIDALLKANGQLFLCADHGNSEKMIDLETNEVFTAHSTNPVPFAVINADGVTGIKKDGKLSDVAPTLLDMMGLEQPAEMTGQSLLIK